VSAPAGAPRLLLAGGGTGGHLMPGLALAAALRRLRPESEIVFLGTREGLDATLVPKAGWRLETVATGRGSPLSLRRPANLPRFLLALWQSWRLLGNLRPAALVALGGFAAAAPGIAAALRGVPLVVLEQNAIPGRVTRLLAPRATQVHLQFAEAAARLRLRPGAARTSGSPLRPEMEALARETPCAGDALLVMGGSQGAEALNRIVAEAVRLPGLAGRRVLHVAGAEKAAAMRAAHADLGSRVETLGFCDDMAGLYRRSRLAIARSGATSLAELAAAGLPALLVPLPTAKDDHQRANARSIAAGGGAVVLDEPGLTGTALAREAGALLDDEPRRAAMGLALRATCRAGAAEAIAREVLAAGGLS